MEYGFVEKTKYRPVSLINIDAKHLNKTGSNQIQKCIKNMSWKCNKNGSKSENLSEYITSLMCYEKGYPCSLSLPSPPPGNTMTSPGHLTTRWDYVTGPCQ